MASDIGRSRVSLGLVALVCISFAGCKGKVDQCNAFIDRANQAQGVIGQLALDSTDPQKLEGEAGRIDDEAKGVGAVVLKDEKLAKLRGDYVTNLGALARNVRSLAKLHGTKGDDPTLSTRAKGLEADADKVEKESSRLVDEINRYCSAP